MSQHWILKKENIKKLWIWSIVLLSFLVLFQFFFPITGHFRIEGWFGFAAWFGFFACVVMILFAKLLGKAVKRPENYYYKNKGNF